MVAVSGYTGEVQGESETSPGILQTNLTRNEERKRNHKRSALPLGHRFFPDPLREVNARHIQWTMSRKGVSSYFVTLTFKDYTSPRRAEKMVRRWLARTQQSLNDTGGGWLKSFLATEWQKREVIHFHLLLVGNGLDSLSRKRIENRWEAMGGGFARCYDAMHKAAPYLAKYTSKTLGGDMQRGGTWRGLQSPISVSRQQVGALTLPG
ncbi:hypothetical protein ES708_30502 [subsurface metagenome]